MVQLPGKAYLDASAVNYQPDLDDTLPDNRRQLRLRVRAGFTQEAAVDGGLAVRSQPRGESTVHADLRRVAERTTGGGRHLDRVGHDYLVRGRHLAALPLGCSDPGAVLRVGVHRHGAATVNHGDELGKAMIRLVGNSNIRQKVAEWVGADVVNIHGGGAYGD
jgi:hypothetical protein